MYSVLMLIGKLLVGIWIPIRDCVEMKRVPVESEDSEGKTKTKLKFSPAKPNKDSWIAGLILGSAMLARGEIGVLILQVSLTTSQANAGSGNAISVMDNETYLIGIWAVAWNTIVGPVAFGQLVKFFGQSIIDSHWGDTLRLKLEEQSRKSISGGPTINSMAVPMTNAPTQNTQNQEGAENKGEGDRNV